MLTETNHVIKKNSIAVSRIFFNSLIHVQNFRSAFLGCEKEYEQYVYPV